MKPTLNQFKYFCFTLLTLNIITAFWGTVYFITTYLMESSYSFLWNVFGFIIIITWLGNLGLLYINDKLIHKNKPIGKKINDICNYFLIFYIIAMILLLLSNVLLSATISTAPTASIPPLVLASIGFYGISVFGIYLTYLNINNLETHELWKFE